MIAKTRAIGMTIGGTNQVFMCISLGASRHHLHASGIRSDGKLVLPAVLSMLTQERFAISPSVVVRKFMRIAVCLKSIQ